MIIQMPHDVVREDAVLAGILEQSSDESVKVLSEVLRYKDRGVHFHVPT
jgi:hypothetical protein